MVCGIDILRILLNFSQLNVAATDLKPSFGKGPLKRVVAKARSCALKALRCTCGSLLLQDWQNQTVRRGILWRSSFFVVPVFVDLKHRDRKLMHVRAYHLLQHVKDQGGSRVKVNDALTP